MHDNRMTFGVLFDVDGTMVRNTPYHRAAWFELCRRYDLELTEAAYLEKVHARSNDKIVVNLFGDAATETLIRTIEREKETIYQDSFRPVLREVPGLTALLAALAAAAIPCAAASNSPQTNVDFVLDGLNLRRYFRAIVNRDMVRVGKPDPEILFQAAAGIGLPPERCLLFEDSSSGFAAARRANMPYIAIGTEPDELKGAHDARAIFADFTGITVEHLTGFVGNHAGPADGTV